MQFPMSNRLRVTALAAALLAAACGGGGGGDDAPRSVTRVVVAGDSLADAGTFGYKFTVQKAGDPAGYPVFPQIVAERFGVTGQCNFYRFAGGTFSQNPTPGCTNFAIGGGRIVNTPEQGGAAAPLNIPTQLATASTAIGGWRAGDLLVVDGGGNDAADLVGAYLGAASGAAGVQAYQTLLLRQIDAPTLQATLGQPNGAVLAAGLYMQRLADTYYNAIKAQALDKGAPRVAVLNVPDITLTPRFQTVLAGVTNAQGATAAAQLRGAIQQWIGAFNTQLRTRVGTDSRIALVDFNAEFTNQVANPGAYGITNAVRPACPQVGTDTSGLPTYNFPACTDAALNGLSSPAGWWQTWAFSDGFHPTPYAHKLLADTVTNATSRAGWR